MMDFSYPPDLKSPPTPQEGTPSPRWGVPLLAVCGTICVAADTICRILKVADNGSLLILASACFGAVIRDVASRQPQSPVVPNSPQSPPVK